MRFPALHFERFEKSMSGSSRTDPNHLGDDQNRRPAWVVGQLRRSV